MHDNDEEDEHEHGDEHEDEDEYADGWEVVSMHQVYIRVSASLYCIQHLYSTVHILLCIFTHWDRCLPAWWNDAVRNERVLGRVRRTASRYI
jgi:hypothetical protein